ncbi:MAG: hypothetical protein Q9204_008093, partial [Flavoplaca sp. TL-2023a]
MAPLLAMMKGALESDLEEVEESRGRRDDDDVLYINAGQDGRKQGADTADLVRRESTATEEDDGRFRHARAKRALRRAKSLKEPPKRSKWFGVFNRRKPASIKSPSPAPAPQLERMRTLEPRPSVETEEVMVGRPRRRLSEVVRMNGGKRGEEATVKEGKEEVNEEDGWVLVPNAHDIEEKKREASYMHPDHTSHLNRGYRTGVRREGGEVHVAFKGG